MFLRIARFLAYLGIGIGGVGFAITGAGLAGQELELLRKQLKQGGKNV